ncbi:MAG: GNAT family N-acetyltransferase [Rhodobacteraceae bacterium]|nr:GNAT family N-acetyltransferase [Paracoccaceae bacterium]
MISEDLSRIEGPNLILRLIQPDDAGYVYTLRSDPTYNRYLSEISGNADNQRQWIESYKKREAELRELYYVIKRKNGVRCGLVRLYNIDAESFTWGSWILDHNKTRNAALESMFLVCFVAFDKLGLLRAHADVRHGNARSLAFHTRFGATKTHETEKDVYFTYPNTRYYTDRARYLAILDGKQEA